MTARRSPDTQSDAAARAKKLLVRGLTTRIGLALAANAIAIIAAALLLRGVRVAFLFFPVMVIVFTAVGLILGPIISRLLDRNVQALTSFAGLIVTFLALVITDVLSDSLTIRGVGTWIMATLVVWLGQLAVQYIVPVVLRDRRQGLFDE